MQFSFKRCVQLLKLQLVTDRKIFLYGALALFAVLLSILMYFVTQEDGLYFELQENTVMEGFLIFLFLVSAACFRHLHARTSRLGALMLPVTVGERIAVGVFIIVVLMPVAYFSIYFLSAGIAHYVDNQILKNGNRFFFFNNVRGMDKFTLGAGLTFITLGLAGGAVFKRFAIIKAAAAFVLLFIAIKFVNDGIASLVLDQLPMTEEMREPKNGIVPERIESRNHSAFSTWYFESRDVNDQFVQHYQVKAPESVLMIENIAGYVMLLGLMYLTVLKLREQELS